MPAAFDEPQTYFNLRQAAEANPDEAAENAAIAKRFNVPVSVVEANRKPMKDEANARDAQAALTLRNAAKTAAWIGRNPQNAKVAKDDVGILSSIESFLSHPMTSLKSGVNQSIAAIDRLIMDGGEVGAIGYIAGAPIAALAGDKEAIASGPPVMRNAGSALVSGTIRTGASVAEGVQWGIDSGDRLLFGYDPTANTDPGWFMNIGRKMEASADQWMPSTDSYIANQILGGIAQTPNTAIALGTGIAGRAAGLGVNAAAALGASTGGFIQGGSSYAVARAQGLTVGSASIYALSDAVTEMAGEYLGNRAFLKASDEGSGIVGRWLKSLVPEIAGEEFTTIAQDFSAFVALPSNQNKTLGDFFAALPEHMASTAIQTLVAHGIVNVTVSGLERALQLPASQARQEAASQRYADAQREQFDQLMRLSEESALRERDPASFASFMQSATEDGALEHVYVDAQALAEVLESNPEAAGELLAAMPGLNESLAEAAETGGDVLISTAELATALPGSTLEKAVVNHLRLDPMAQSAAERTSENDQLVAKLSQSFQEQAASELLSNEAEQSRDRVSQGFLDQLNVADRFTLSTNQQYANLLGNFFAVQGAKIGLSAEEMATRYPLQIRSTAGADALPNRMGQDATYLNIGLDTSAAGDGAPLSVDQVREALAAVGVKAEAIDVQQSASEPTAIVRIAQPLTAEQGDAVSRALKQEAIAQRRGEEGDLFGPKAEEWGPYNPDYFLMPERVELAQSAQDNPRSAIVAGQMGKTIGQLLDMAAENQVRLAELGARLREQAKVEFINPGPKKPARAIQKFEQHGLDAPGELTDLARGSFIIATPDQGEAIVRMLQRSGLTIYDKGWVRLVSSYTDRKLIVRFPNGGVAELQLRPLPIAAYAKGDGHKMYKEARDLTVSEERRNALMEHMREAYSALLAGTAFEALAKERENSASESSAPSTDSLAESSLDAGTQADRASEKTETSPASLTESARPSNSKNVIETSTPEDKNRVLQAQGEVAGWTPERVDSLIEAYGHGETSDAFMTWLSPAEYLNLTASEKGQEMMRSMDPERTRARKLDEAALRAEEQPILLGISGLHEPSKVQISMGVGERYGKYLPEPIVAHEGRHRMVALEAAGVTRVPVVIEVVNQEVGETLDKLNVSPQTSRLSPLNNGPKGTVLRDLVPITEANRAQLLAMSNEASVFFQGERGFIEFGKDVTADASVISLLNASDLSTLLHESGHFFLEVMAHMASQTSAPADVVRDMNGALKWMGVPGIAAWESMTIEEKRPFHEKFARGFEAYLFEGKAPNFELRSLFRTFKQWLVAVYRNNIKALKAPLNAEIRGVFNRMLASADTIAEAQRQARMAPFFDTKPDTMTAAEWDAYQKLGADATADAVDELQSRSLRDMRYAENAKSRELKRLQKETAAKRESTEEEVRIEVEGEPVYRALDYIRAGRINGEEQDGEHFLNVAAFNALYDDKEKADREAAKRKIGFRNFRREGGVDPSSVAELFGFGSAREMINSILAAQPKEVVIEGETDSRMLERYGDINSQEALDRAASEAIHNEVRLRFVATELSMLDRSIGKARDLARAAKSAAQDIVGRLKVREIKPAKFEAAERRAAKAAEQARKEGNTALAAQAKRNQLLNLHATREARRAMEDANSAVQYFRKFSRKGVRENLDVDYLDQIDAMLERFDFRVTGLDEAQLARRAQKASLSAFIEDQREAGFEPVFAGDPLIGDETQRKNYRDMTMDEMRGLRDAVKNIEFLARARHSLLKGIEQMALSEAMERGAAAVNENAYKIVNEPLGSRTWMERAKSQVDDFLAMHRKFSSLVREMDGNKDRGQLWMLFSRPMNAASNTEATMTADATAKMAEIFKPLRGTDTSKKTYEPAIDRAISLETRLSVALNMGNSINIERILSGEKWTVEQLQAVVAPLTSEQWQYVQNVWNFIGSYWSDIAAKQRRVTGIEPEQVEAVPITVRSADGEVVELAGGYYPIKYDPDRSSRAEADTEAEVQRQITRGLYTSAQTRRGHTKARTESTGRPLRYDFGVTFEHVGQVVHDLAWHETLIDMNRLLRSGEIEASIRKHYGPAALRWMRKALEDIAIGGVGAQSSIERGFNYLRTGATVAGLGWNLMTSLMQPLGLANSMVRVGPRYVARGMARALTDAASLNNTAKWISEQSEFMRLRGQTQQREIAEIRQSFAARGPLSSAAAKLPGAPVVMDAVSGSFFILIEKAQRIADVPTWAGAYEKAIDQGEDHATAVAFADQTVRDSQGGGQLSDLAGVQRGSALMKLWTNFYSWFNVAYNQLAESVNDTRRVGASRIPLLAVDFLLIAVMPSLMMSLLRGALAGDDDEEMRSRIANDQASGYLGFIFGLRELGAAFGVGNAYSGPAGARAISATVNLGKQVKQGEADEAFWRAANSTAGVLLHYPATQVDRTVRGVEALANGESKNPLVVFTGPPPKK